MKSRSSRAVDKLKIGCPQEVITGIGGSPRKNGNSDVILNQIVKGAASRVRTRQFHLRDFQFKPCIGCERCRTDNVCSGLNDGMFLLYPEIIASQGLILVSPTHHYNITAWMKAFIDRLYCFYVFNNQQPRGWTSRLAGQGRKAAIAAICEQASKSDMGFTLDAMRRPLEALGYDIVGELAVFQVFERGKVKEQPDVLKSALALGSDLVAAL